MIPSFTGMYFLYKVVLKCRFYYYSGMVKPTDKATTATEKTVCYSQFSRRGGMPHYTGPQRVVLRWVGRQKEKRETWGKAFTWFPQERKGKAE